MQSNQAHTNWVNATTFSPDGSKIVTAGGDWTAQIWDAADVEPVGVPLKHKREVKSASFSRDGLRIVTASADKTAQIWDVTSGQAVGSPLQHA